MPAASEEERAILTAPERLISSTRREFRTRALAHLEQLRSEHITLAIDLAETVEIDASGLGILVLLQKRARERGLSTILHHAPERVRNLLKLTMLDFLFEFTD